MSPVFTGDSTYQFRYNGFYVWNIEELPIEFNSIITGVYDQDWTFTFIDNPVYPSGDPNAVNDQFMSPVFTGDSTYQFRYKDFEVYTGNSMWNEFWYDVPEIFDQKFILDSTNIVSFFGA